MAKLQQELPLPPPPSTRGGRRAGAGRPRSSGNVQHVRRGFLESSQPVHVTLRLRDDVPNLRTRDRYLVIRRSTITVSKRARFRIVQMSIQRDHIHLIVEAANRVVLARGIQSFAISVARRLNSALMRRGKVFADRYHAHVLRTPSEVRRALAYVMNNWRKHGRDGCADWVLDPYSSAISFHGWPVVYPKPRGYLPLVVQYPRTWLLERGWRRAGTISTTEIPGRAGKESLRPSRSHVVDSRT